MTADKPWRDKSYLYDRYINKRMTLGQIHKELLAMGYKVTEMTIYTNLKKFELIRKPRQLGKRTFGKKPGQQNSFGKKRPK